MFGTATLCEKSLDAEIHCISDRRAPCGGGDWAAVGDCVDRGLFGRRLTEDVGERGVFEEAVGERRGGCGD